MVTCLTPRGNDTDVTIVLRYDGGVDVTSDNVSFSYLINPVVEDVTPRKSYSR